ncbi:GNAT family N-acetyltransferase [Paraburkholderia xenovorans]|uniref:GNAT family N-acetyltransferase n=1 Tax=Paraburkholderia xenovorans TaxID=36873 RepID=UPI001ED91490|nr:GNAT family N-acetyltransferase [Paraburkholderia xenovorans]
MDRDPEVVKFVAEPWNDHEAHARFLKHRIEADFGRGLGYWSIFPKENPVQFLGWVLLTPYDAVGPGIEIGWRLARKGWGHGYATEAARRVATLDPDRPAQDAWARRAGRRRSPARPCDRSALPVRAGRGSRCQRRACRRPSDHARGRETD